MNRRPWLVAGLAVAVALTAAALAAGAASAPSARQWHSDWFVSPTHNIHCRWWGQSALIACTTQNDDFMTAVTVWGQPWHKHNTWGYTFPNGPTLYYGETFTAHNASGTAVARCWSRSVGMTCRSLKTNRGFFISREGYRLYG
jgi:hypothetical protein